MDIAIVTGASSGLGWEFAKQIAKRERLDEGWVIARRKERLEQLSGQLATKAISIIADLSKEKDIQTILKKLEKERPNVRFLVNNAGLASFGEFAKMPLDKHLHTMDVNMTALVRLTHGVLPYMHQQSTIIQVGSVLSFLPMPNNAIYAATKAFVLSFSNALAAELQERRIHVITVCPGPVDTEFWEVMSGTDAIKNPRAAKPKDVVRLALRDAKRGRWVSVYSEYMKLRVFTQRFFSQKQKTLILKGTSDKRKRKIESK